MYTSSKGHGPNLTKYFALCFRYLALFGNEVGSKASMVEAKFRTFDPFKHYGRRGGDVSTLLSSGACGRTVGIRAVNILGF